MHSGFSFHLFVLIDKMRPFAEFELAKKGQLMQKRLH